MKMPYCLERWSGVKEDASFRILKNITESAYTHGNIRARD
jgi:hypothetical protein